MLLKCRPLGIPLVSRVRLWMTAWLLITLAMTSLTPAIAEPIVVRDYFDRKVILPRPARRIIALAPHIVENLYEAGAGSYLVGAVEYSDYPASAKTLPRVGAISRFSLETIIDLKPDLVVVWMSTRGGEILTKLEALGIPTYASDPHTLSDVARSVRDYGVLSGTTSVAEAAAQAYERKLRELASAYMNQSPVKVFYQVWFEPLQTLSGKHIISDVIQLCGGTNVFAEQALLAPRVSLEAVITRNPDAIVAASGAGDYDALAEQWSRWPHLTAVKHQHLFTIPGDFISRHTVRILHGAELLCQQLDSVRH